MNQLKLISLNGQFVADSRDVAEMSGKEHPHLMRDMRGYKAIMDANPDLDSANFFIESSYIDSQNQVRPKFDLTRKGCDMVANKMTGEKGVLFTAVYVTKFDEMERSQSQIDISKLSNGTQLLHQMFQVVAKTELDLLETRKELADVKSTMNSIQETFTQRDDDWRKSINGLLTSAAFRMGGNYRDLRSESYRVLEERAHCDLNKRLRNLKDRLAESGATKTKIEGMSRMDIIEEDAKLKEIYTMISKEISIGSLKIAK